MNDMPTVSIVVAAQRFDALRNLITSVTQNTKTVDYEWVIVTTGRVPAELADAFPRWPAPPLTLIHDKGEGCVKAFNLGFKAARGDFVVHLNDDCEVQPDWLKNMLAAIGDRKVEGAFAFSSPFTEGFVTQEYVGKPYANFGCLPRDLLAEVGYFDERFPHYGADPDLGLKLWHAGYEVVPVMDARIIHHCTEDEHRREDLREPAAEILHAKWKGIFL